MSAHVTASLTRLAVVGASGRMGKAVVRLASESGVKIVAAIASTDVGVDVGTACGLTQLGVAISNDVNSITTSGAECVIDFSSPALLPQILDAAATCGAALVSGTTGFGEREESALKQAQSRVAVLWEPNMSVGVFVLSELVKRAVMMLGDSCDIEITEAHHKLKVDAPSGTAMRLAEVAARAAAHEGGSELVFGRSGKPGARAAREISVLAMRGGDVIGDHTVHLLCAGERIELTHRATNRDLFASGALRAAHWIVKKSPGRYALADVLATA